MGLFPLRFRHMFKVCVYQPKLNNMDKITEIKFVGQSIFKEILHLIDAVNI